MCRSKTKKKSKSNHGTKIAQQYANVTHAFSEKHFENRNIGMLAAMGNQLNKICHTCSHKMSISHQETKGNMNKFIISKFTYIWKKKRISIEILGFWIHYMITTSSISFASL